MKLQRTFLGLLALGILSLAAVAYAGPMHGQGHGGHGRGMMTSDCPMGGGMGAGMGAGHMGRGFMQSLTPEQQQKFQTLRNEFVKKTEDLRSDMWAKHTELEALAGNDKVEPSYITKLVQEMKEIGTKLRAERDAFAQRVEKEVGVPYYGHGFGPNGDCPAVGGATGTPDAAPAN